MRPLQAHCHHRWNCSIPGPMLRLQKYSGQKVHLNFVGVSTIERIRHRRVFLGKNDRTILSRTQPIAHAVLKLVDVHGVPMAFVTDELLVQLCQESGVCSSREPIVHGHTFCCAHLRYHHELHLAERSHSYLRTAKEYNSGRCWQKLTT